MIDLLKAALSSQDPDLLVAAYKLASSPYYQFRPRPDRPELLDEQTSYVTDRFDGIACVLGGNRSGKSRCSAYKVAKFLRETPPPDRTTRYWVCSQTMEMAAGVCWSQHLEEFLPEARVTGWYSEAKGYPSSVVYDHPAGGRWMVEVKSYDMGRQALQGAAIGGFWADEQIPHSLLTEVLARTSNYRLPGSKVYSLTPIKPDYDLERIYAERERHPGWRFYRFNTLANPTVDHTPGKFAEDEIHEAKIRFLPLAGLRALIKLAAAPGPPRSDVEVERIFEEASGGFVPPLTRRRRRDKEARRQARGGQT